MYSSEKMKSKKTAFTSSGPFVFVYEGFFRPVLLNCSVFVVGHLLWFASIIIVFRSITPLTFIWNWFLTFWSALGVTAGAHRLWAHRTYKARLPLKIFLAIGQSIGGQNCIYVWCRDHRVHHKFSDTDADPHNINRGIFFSHVGWLLLRKHPEVSLKGLQLDMQDLLSDPVVSFQMKYYYIIYVVFALILPIACPIFLWNESFLSSFFICYIFRQGFVLHSTWFVNSAAHLFGHRPFKKEIRPADNSFVSFFSVGEGYHNFHHTFPFDYATGELGSLFNFTKVFIDVMERIAFAYDLRFATYQMIDKARHCERKSNTA